MLSIVAVAINNTEVNKRFVSSIRQYTRGRYELVLIDNGSTDRKTSSFLKKSADVYHRFDEIVSLSEAWNKGIELSKGDYVAVANNDTVVPPDWFKPLKQTLDRYPKAGMVHPMTFWLLKGYLQYRMLKNFDPGFSKPFKLPRYKDIVWGEFMVFKRAALQAVGGFNQIYERAGGEDLEMVFQLFSKGFDIYVDSRIFVYHQGHASQTPDVISKKSRDKYWDKNWKLFLSRWPKYTKDWK